ncbi:hypothetical protein D0X99_11445 [Algoriphagus lacus]|uniref:Lipoprotein n=1 Tax=Algoriphagus lacus TaxID=2056311 RepID=A0A418PR48_9BACT|nr:hypothetical protein [Algoriphagus lacus]RIW15057.1 hypothetical protein D0X99_11445 [Algoriphagus lacus]
MSVKFVNRAPLLGLLFSVVLLSACNEEPEVPSPPVSEIVHKKLTQPEFFTYGTPKVLDLDGDAVIDFQFGVTLFANQLGDHYQYVVSPSRANRALLIEEEAIPLEVDFEIGETSDQNDLVWNFSAGKLITKLQRQTGAPSWSGNWSTIPDGIVGVRFFIGQKPHYGWIKIGNDLYSNRMSILEYAYQSVPGKSIKSGQTN